MFFYSQPDPILHVTASLQVYLEPTNATSTYFTLLNGSKISSSGGVDSFYFDGTNDYAYFTSSLNAITARAFTISLWTKVPYNNTSKGYMLLSNKVYKSYVVNGGLIETYDGFNTIIQNGQVIANISQYRTQGQISYDQGGVTISTSAAREGRVDDGNWHNIVITSYGGTPYTYGYISQDLQIYLDTKVATGAGSTTGNPSIWSHANTLLLGNGLPMTWPNSLFSGHASAIQIYDRRLSTAEIQQNYDAFKTRFGRQ